MLNARDSIRARKDDTNREISFSLARVPSLRSFSSSGGRPGSEVSYIVVIHLCFDA